jgi:ribonucleoside-triphosphate reductase
MIEPPKSFQVACTNTTQIIAAVASGQYGGQSVDLKHLGKYLKYSKDKFKEEMNNKYKKQLSKELIDALLINKINI